MATAKEWIALAKRCEEATGPGREIDVEIALAIDLHPLGLQRLREIIHMWGTTAEFVSDLTIGNAWARMLPSYTASLDAITALMRTELPGWMVRVQWCGLSAEAWVAPDLNSPVLAAEIRADEARWHDYADRNEVELRPGSEQAAILALCAAFCRAMAERSEA